MRSFCFVCLSQNRPLFGLLLNCSVDFYSHTCYNFVQISAFSSPDFYCCSSFFLSLFSLSLNVTKCDKRKIWRLKLKFKRRLMFKKTVFSCFIPTLHCASSIAMANSITKSARISIILHPAHQFWLLKSNWNAKKHGEKNCIDSSWCCYVISGFAYNTVLTYFFKRLAGACFNASMCHLL